MFDEHSPIYRQIADHIRDDILNGTLAEGDRVMSTNQYAAHFRINPATAAKAFQELVDEGVLYKQRGIGMFVSPGALAMLQAQHRERFFMEFVEPMIARARVLGIPMDEVIRRVARAAAEDGT